MKMAVFWVVAPSIIMAIALMMEAASTSVTSVNFYQTIRRNNPEDSHLHTHRRENLIFTPSSGCEDGNCNVCRNVDKFQHSTLLTPEIRSTFY
jgi:hypothetical protein